MISKGCWCNPKTVAHVGVSHCEVSCRLGHAPVQDSTVSWGAPVQSSGLHSRSMHSLTLTVSGCSMHHLSQLEQLCCRSVIQDGAHGKLILEQWALSSAWNLAVLLREAQIQKDAKFL